jgi:DNA topoisomerase-1
MSDARVERTKISASTTDTTIPSFTTQGSRVLFDGWLIADPFSQEEDITIPSVEKGDPVIWSDVTATAKETEPPRRYSEAGLIKELEKRGIGRPSTYASIIKTIIDRGYVISEQRSLIQLKRRGGK